MASTTITVNKNVDDIKANAFIIAHSGAATTQTSPDGITWTSRVTPISTAWQGVAYKDEIAVMVSSTSGARLFAYSCDGITWTSGTLPSNVQYYDVAYGAGVFVTVGKNSKVTAYSNDGINWTSGTISSIADWRTLTYGASGFVALGYNSNICAKSTNGITWTSGNILTSNSNWVDVAYDNTLQTYVAISYGTNVSARSIDGLTWTSGNLLHDPSNWSSIASNNLGRFVAVSANNDTVSAYSDNGTSWTSGTMSAVSTWLTVAYAPSGSNGGVWLAGGATTVGASSIDGAVWVARTQITGSKTNACAAPYKWRSGDTLVIQNGAVVTVNTEQSKFWNVITHTNGLLNIVNTNTASGITFAMGRKTYGSVTQPLITPAGGQSIINISGNWINLGTSNGLSNQTMVAPFSDYIPSLWVQNSSGTYDIWLNCLGTYGYSNKMWKTEFDEIGSGDRGMFFSQVPNPSYDGPQIFTGGSTSGDLNVYMTNTSGLFPGAALSGVGIPNDTVVENVYSNYCTVSNQTTPNTGPNTFYAINPYRQQLTNVIKFNNGIYGNIPVSGAIVKCPNIMITDFTPAHIQTASWILGGGSLFTAGGVFKSKIALFDETYHNFGQAQIVNVEDSGWSIPPLITECYGLVMNRVGFGLRPVRRFYNGTLWNHREGRWGTTLAWSKITGAKITDLCFCSYGAASAIGAATGSMAAPSTLLNLSYSSNMTWKNIRAYMIWSGKAAQCSLGCSSYVFNSIFDNLKFFGSGTSVFLSISDGNTISNVKTSASMFNYQQYWIAGHRIGFDPMTGNELIDGQKYYLKVRSYRSWTDLSQYYEGGIVSVTPFKAGYLFPGYLSVCPLSSRTVKFDWINRIPTAQYDIFRSQTPGFTARDNSTRIWTTATAATITINDSPIPLTSIPAAPSKPLTFNAAKTITCPSGSFITDGFAVGRPIVVTGTTKNNGTYMPNTVVAATITVNEPLVAEGPLTSSAILSGVGPVDGQTYYYRFRKYNSTASIVCTGVSGQYTLTSAGLFQNGFLTIPSCYGTSGSNIVTIAGVQTTTNFTSLMIGQPVSGYNINPSAYISSIDDYNQLTLTQPNIGPIIAQSLSFGVCSGMAAYPTIGATIPFPIDAKVVSYDNPNQITLDKPLSSGFTSTAAIFKIFNESSETEVYVSGYNTVTNLCLYSNDYTNAAWTNSNVTVVGAAESGPCDPYLLTATLSACKLTTTSGNAYIQQYVVAASGLPHTANIWVRTYNGGTSWQNSTPIVSGSLSFGATTTPFVATPIWSRVSATYTTIAPSSLFKFTINNSGSYMFATGAAVQSGSLTTPYAYTTTPVVYLNPAAQEITQAYVYCDDSETSNQGVYLNFAAAPTTTVFSDVFIGTSSNFVPSNLNKVVTTLAGYNSIVNISTSTNNIFSNFSEEGVGGQSYYLAYLTSASNSVFKNFYVRENYALTGGFSIATTCNNLTFHNWDIIRHRTYVAANYQNVSANDNLGLIMQNIRYDKYGFAYNNLGFGTVLKGVGGLKSKPLPASTIWYLGSTTDSINISAPQIYDSIFNEFYQSINTGSLNLTFTASQKILPPYVLSGNAAFTNTGKLGLVTAGDGVTYTWDHRIYGVSGFRNIAPKLNGLDLGTDVTTLTSLYLEYALDTTEFETGYSNFKLLTGDNLSTETVSASGGFRMKIRITALPGMKYSTKASNFVLGETIRGFQSNATATISYVEENTALIGSINLTNISGIFAPGEFIKTNDLTTTRCTNVVTNTQFALYPQQTSYIDGLQIYTNVNQTVNYPFTTVNATLSLTGLKNNTEVRVYRTSDNTYLAGVDNCSGVFTYNYIWDDIRGDVNVYIRTIALGYQWMTFENQLLGQYGLTIPVQQLLDRQFSNPV